HRAAALLGGPEANEVELAGVAHPRRAVERSISGIPPPQAHVALARATAAGVGGVEARDRAVAGCGSDACACPPRRDGFDAWPEQRPYEDRREGSGSSLLAPP